MKIAGLVGLPMDSRVHLAALARWFVPEQAQRFLQDTADESPRLRRLAAGALADRFIGWR